MMKPSLPSAPRRHSNKFYVRHICRCRFTRTPLSVRSSLYSLPSSCDFGPLVVPSARDASFLYQEVVKEDCYLTFIDSRNLKRQIDVSSGIVVDVGANIGMFALHALNNKGAARVISVEPAYDTFSMLQKNAASHDNLTVIRAAVGNPPRGNQTNTAVLTTYTNCSGWASVQPRPDGDVLEDVVCFSRDLAKRATHNSEDAQLFDELAGGKMQATILRTCLAQTNRNGVLGRFSKLAESLVRLQARRILQSSQVEEVPLLSLDAILAMHVDDCDDVALLKVDVEGLEHQVLEGLTRRWERVKAVVCETHGGDDASDAVASKLRSVGKFDEVHVTTPIAHSKLRMVYAARHLM